MKKVSLVLFIILVISQAIFAGVPPRQDFNGKTFTLEIVDSNG